ncbi:hypothetical protein G6F70_006118 [Rhizopus microsporus]|nr:hypothetical protein G6F71_005945 [Rhizopus microsporus]KAG1198062.1 hypothetical protein G6F70_006118 [Rhizopus microsporus]KAG1230258.1 hypothetical protein G6F67_006578 [Rhizopus microsporus]KAG1262405.1 hypothetical protein G6F68_005970 [Rhizopus microsporus]
MSLWSNKQTNEYEMREVVDLDSYIAQVDGRNSLNILDITSDDNGSDSTMSIDEGYKYNYEQRNFEGDEAEQSLVNNNENSSNDIEGGEVHKNILNKQKKAKSIDQQSNKAKHIDFPDLYNTSFFPKSADLKWVHHDSKDGLHTYIEPLTGSIIMESIEDDNQKILVDGSRLKVNNNPITYYSYEISNDNQYVLFTTNLTKQWRHSTLSNVYIFDIARQSLLPLNNMSTIHSTPAISQSLWSPSGHQLAYVMNNDLYVTNLVNHTRITYDGSSTIFNGVLDWVYEEEVFDSNLAMWWSPDSTHIAYLRSNETNVHDIRLQHYTQENSIYPEETVVKYPKPGAPNPQVSLHVHSLLSNTSVVLTSNSAMNITANITSNFKEFNETDRIITDVLWATNSSTHLLFKQTNRVQDIELTSLVTFNKSGAVIENVRTYKPADDGWIESSQSMIYLSTSYRAKKSKHTTWLTVGKYEVIPRTIVIDRKRNFLHYISTEQSHLERHLYRINLNSTNPSSTKMCLTCSDDPTQHAYYSASFSSLSGYYVLDYMGPDVPTSVVKSVDNPKFEKVLQDNSALKELISNYELPKARMVTVKSGGVSMDARELLPPDFDATKKYPVLFQVYGGPGSQTAAYTFELNWSTFLASKLGYIVVNVDGRGTGFKGRKYRVGVKGRLGELETIDQINAAKHWASLEYVDPARIAIWGWSYGGYLTSKVIEANSGLFIAGMAVAPVTDWRYYDSIYTERYMLTPQMNPDGYNKSAVNNMEGFNNAKFFLVHGTADDNVHFQNSAVLVNKLIQANVHNYQVQYFPDSDHNIDHGNANQNLYYLLTNFLWESFGGKEYLHVRKELNGHFSGPLTSSEH